MDCFDHILPSEGNKIDLMTNQVVRLNDKSRKIRCIDSYDSLYQIVRLYLHHLSRS